MVITFFRGLSYLPLRVLHAIGFMLGGLTWLFSPTYRRHMRENMVLALGETRARALQYRAIGHAGRQFMELPKIWLRPLETVVSHVREVSGGEHVKAALATGGGIVYLTPHLGCFEITAQYLSTIAPITVLYRPPKRAFLQKLIEMGRTRDQLYIAPADMSGVRMLMKALKKGEALGLLPDQAPKKGEGRWLNFFGRPAYTMTLAARLTENAASVILVWAERLDHGRGYHLHFEQPATPIEGTIEERAQRINEEMERLILKCPQQYLWGYNRYKRPGGAEPPPSLS